MRTHCYEILFDKSKYVHNIEMKVCYTIEKMLVTHSKLIIMSIIISLALTKTSAINDCFRYKSYKFGTMISCLIGKNECDKVAETAKSYLINRSIK
jgi:hypothetical protein